jgi:hypothetical protein
MTRSRAAGALMVLLASAGITVAVVLPAVRSDAQVTPGCAAAQASYNALQAAYLELATQLRDAGAAQSTTQDKVNYLIAEMTTDRNTVTQYKQLDSAVDDDVAIANNVIANDDNGIKGLKDQSLSTGQAALLKGLTFELNRVLAQMNLAVSYLAAGQWAEARILVREAAATQAVALLKFADPFLDFATEVDLVNILIPISKTLASTALTYQAVTSDLNKLQELEPAYDAAQAELTGPPSLQSVINEGKAAAAAEGQTIANLTIQVNAAHASAQQAQTAATAACAPTSSPSTPAASPTATASLAPNPA